MAQQPRVDQVRLIIEASRSHSDILRWVGLLWTNGQLVAETSTWQTTYNTNKGHTSMSSARFEPSNPSKGAVTNPLLSPRGHWIDNYFLYQNTDRSFTSQKSKYFGVYSLHPLGVSQHINILVTDWRSQFSRSIPVFEKRWTKINKYSREDIRNANKIIYVWWVHFTQNLLQTTLKDLIFIGPCIILIFE